MGKRNAENDIHVESPCKKTKIDLEHSFGDVAQEFVLTKEIVDGTILTDLSQKDWKVGKPIGKGSFGEIFLASNDTSRSVTSDNAKYVVKIEPHSNGPLFVEIHCLINIGKPTNDEPLPPGMPEYIASGSHYFKNAKYRFLILPRYKCDLHSIIKNRRVDQKHVLIIGCQVLDVLEHIHDKGYAHSDIKAENLMIGTCTYTQKNVNGNGNSNNEHDCDTDDEDSDSNHVFRAPRNQRVSNVQYSGTNPVRSCRMSRKNSTYQAMLSSHYLRPSKKINYVEADDEDDDDYKTHRYSNGKISTLNAMKKTKQSNQQTNVNHVTTEDRIFLIDFGLASKFVDSSGAHRPFCMDQRRAHDGTLEFTSRDAHMGAHSRRSDLECLGYNLMYWCQGTLPWRDEKLMTQPEQVHRMKEYFMTDIKKVFKDIYGSSAPKFLCDFLEYVGGLAYHDRPDYNYCRTIFTDELKRMGCKTADLRLDVNELKKKPIRKLNTDLENNSIVQLKNVKEMLRLGLRESLKENGTTRISPKNLRSKSDKIPKKHRKHFSWTDVLSTDPDQIARQRAEKEFARDQTGTPMLSRYKGKPTYAILEVENKIRFKDKLVDHKDDKSDDDNIKGYTKPMMDILRKRQFSILSQLEKKKKVVASDKSFNNISTVTDQPKRTGRATVQKKRKTGLRNYVRPTEKSIFYRDSLLKKSRNNNGGNSEFTPTDESSCSSTTSDESSKTKSSGKGWYDSDDNGGYSTSSGAVDDDSRDTTDYMPVKVRYTKRSTEVGQQAKRRIYLTRKLQNGKVNRPARDESEKRLRAFTRG